MGKQSKDIKEIISDFSDSEEIAAELWKIKDDVAPEHRFLVCEASTHIKYLYERISKLGGEDGE
ncbi:MAG: hypothetical protein ACK5NC_05205 [Vibrio sp.]